MHVRIISDVYKYYTIKNQFNNIIQYYKAYKKLYTRVNTYYNVIRFILCWLWSDMLSSMIYDEQNFERLREKIVSLKL